MILFLDFMRFGQKKAQNGALPIPRTAGYFPLMKVTRAFLSSLGLYLALALTAACLIGALAFAFAAIFQTNDPSSTIFARVFFAICCVLTGLCLISWIMAIVGRAKILNEVNVRDGHRLLLIAGIIGFNVPLVLAGIFGLRQNAAEEKK